MFDTPILLIIFNRPHTTRRVLEVIRQMQPRQLFVAADGARSDHPDDEEKCEAARAVVDEMVDWPCALHKNYAEVNMGCGPRPATAITWFFENVERGIILEDDCVPHPTFFRFCEELLEYYNDNERVMHISGNNFQFGRKRGKASYYFSIYPLCWGWATWRRAWKHYDFNIASLEARQHIWDFQWMKAVRRNTGLAIMPEVDLVSNIGHGDDATHTKEDDHLINVPTYPIEFPLLHPISFTPDSKADRYTYYTRLRRAKTPLHRVYMEMEDMIRESIQRAQRVMQRIGNVAR